MNAVSYALMDGENISARESAVIDELLVIMRLIQEEKERRTRPVPRTIHPKQHGCLRGELLVERELPDAFQQGIFRPSQSYKALVRFSNAKQRDDRLPDGHGMGIKLVGVGGERLPGEQPEAQTQDFVLVDHPVFFAKDAADLVPLIHDFRRLMIGGVTGKIRTVFKAMFSRDPRFRLLRKMGAKRPDSPLEIQYWSTTPMKFGDGAAKISLLPQLNEPPIRAANSPDKLRLAMAAKLAVGEARFDFLVQLRTNPMTMPLEDATAIWDEAESPYRKVATLRIPRQTFDSPEQNTFGENLSFSPWHAVAAHRPLGSINRARRRIYEAMAARRIELNGVTTSEPTLAEVGPLFFKP